MVGLFETLWARNELRLMNAFQVDALFTALIQLSAEMRVTNPILSANAMRRFDSALDILRSLAEYWLNAEIVLRLFEDSSERMRQELRVGKSLSRRDDSVTEQSDSALDVHSQGGVQVDGWQDFIPSPNTALQHLGVLNDQLDFANMYWEGAGFSPFTDIGLYPNPPS
jgi:transcriptional regulatory protein AMDR